MPVAPPPVFRPSASDACPHPGPAAEAGRATAGPPLDRDAFELEGIAGRSLLRNVPQLFAGAAGGLPAVPLRRSRSVRPIASLRGYDPDDVDAIASMGYHYARAGCFRFALVIFEGLAAIIPEVGYFALAAGYAAEHNGERSKAREWYRRAGEVDPADGRADVNLAELLLEDGERNEAIAHLQRGRDKAARRRDEALERKASALLGLLSPAGLPSGRRR